jgi:hypothetical protein
MMDGNQGTLEGRGERFREGHTDEERPDESGSLRDGDRIEITQRHIRRVEGRADDSTDVADVLPRRELGNDPTPLLMQGDLRRHDIRSDRPTLAGLGHHGRRSLVARCLDPEHQHTKKGVRPLY